MENLKNDKIDRIKYWNDDYVKYWKKMTDEAEKSSDISTVDGKVPGDYSTSGVDTIAEFLNNMDLQPKEKVLDYGCGLGRFFDYISQRSEYYGIDISEGMIKVCKQKYPLHEDRFMVAEGENLPFEDGFFDKVVCVGVFDACYQEAALMEMLRIVKDGGKILISGKGNKYNLDDEQAYIAEEAARRKGHPNYFTDVKSMLEQVKKFVSVEEERYFPYRGDMRKGKYTHKMPETFYEWVLIIRKIGGGTPELNKFSNKYSITWQNKSAIVQ